jgi:hypothetical protein
MIIPGPIGTVVAGAAAALAALALAACGSSSSGGSGSGATPPSTGSAASSGSGGTDAAAAAAIKDAYAKFFAPDTPEQVSLGLLQNGPQFKAAVEQQGGSSYAQKSSAKVSEVSVVSPTTAKVTFTIYVNGQAMLRDQPGYAVKQDGTWKIAEYTFCGLLTLEGSPPDACKSATAKTPPK